MKVKIRWSETVDYESVIEISDADYRDWLDSDEAPTPESVKDFIQSGEENDWFEQVNTITDFMAVETRQVDEVML